MISRSVALTLLLAHIAPAAPVITSATPGTIDAGGPYFQMTLAGSGFTSSASASLSGVPLDTFYVSATQIRAAITPALRALSGRFDLTVANGDGTPSNSLSILVLPVIGSVSPPLVAAGSSGTTITVTGIGFVSRNLLVLSTPGRQTLLATVYQSSSRLTATIPAAQLISSASASLSVFDPLSGQTSSQLPFTIQAPPSISSAIPNPVNAGGPFFLLAITGIGFVPSSVVSLGAAPLVTTYISPTQLQAAITPELRSLSGIFNLSVTTPDGLVSSAYSFRISPVLSAVAPSSAPVRGPALPIAVQGIGFTPQDQIQFVAAGQPIRLATTYASSTNLTATIPAAMLLSPGVAAVQVVDSAGLGASDAISFPIRTAPLLTSLAPNPMDAGGPGLIATLTGAGLDPGSVLFLAGVSVPSAIVAGPSRITFPVTPEMRALSGAYSLTVTDPYGAASSPLALLISPVLFSIAQPLPGQITATGVGFTRSSVLTLDSRPLPTTLVNSTTLSAALPSPPSTRVIFQVVDSASPARSLELPVDFTPPPPTATIAAVLNAFSAQRTAAPGSLISVYGTGLSTPVTINNVAAPALYAGGTQINAQVPFETRPGPATLSVPGAASVTLEVSAVAPGLLTTQDTAYAIAQDPDGNLITPEHPDSPGQYVTIYLTGQGLLDRSLPSGAPAPIDPLLHPLAPVQATLAARTLPIPFAGLAPGYIGLLQINLLIPEDLPEGDLPLVITIGGIQSNRALLPVRSH